MMECEDISVFLEERYYISEIYNATTLQIIMNIPVPSPNLKYMRNTFDFEFQNG